MFGAIASRLLPALLTAMLGLLSGGCAGARGGGGIEGMSYLETLLELEAEGLALERGSEPERRAVERFQALLGDFKAADFRERIGEVYAADVFFNDTLKTVRGVAELERYLGRSGDALESGTVEFLDLAVADGNYYFRWRMSLRFAKFSRGETHESNGMSHIRFDRDGRVVLHQDFWDSSSGLFEHVPVLGWMLRGAKSRL